MRKRPGKNHSSCAKSLIFFFLEEMRRRERAEQKEEESNGGKDSKLQFEYVYIFFPFFFRKRRR